LTTVLSGSRLVLMLPLPVTLVTASLLFGGRSSIFLPRAPPTFGNLLFSQLILRRTDATIGRTLLAATTPAAILGSIVGRAIISIRPRISTFRPRG
jgi:hypothetical protein